MPASTPEWLYRARLAVGDRIRSARLHANLTQEGLAERLQVERRTIVRWELGISSPPLDRILETLRIELVPVSAHQAAVARAAYRRYGRGSGSPARLNFGDCFSYALAASLNARLLFKGDDFGQTDVAAELA